jgi:uncharacterized protein YigA (DUF484 family)
VVDLLEARNNADLARRLDEVARIRFDLMGAAIGVEGAAPAGWKALTAGVIDHMLGAEGQAWMGPNALANVLFAPTETPIESCALIRLALWRDGAPGVLAFASAEAEGFTPDMGVELIALLARVVERTAERWPVV